MSTVNQIKDADIDSSGIFKYILINIKDKSAAESKNIVRGYKHCEYHGEF